MQSAALTACSTVHWVVLVQTGQHNALNKQLQQAVGKSDRQHCAGVERRPGCSPQGLPHHHGIDGGSAAIARDGNLCSIKVIPLKVALLLPDPVVDVHCIKVVLQAGEPLQGQLRVASHLVPAAAREKAQHCGRKLGIAA